MYAFAPSWSARWRSSLEPSVVMMMIGTSLCVGSPRTRLTSLSPSMMGMLMSVMMMSNFPPASFRSPSTPSSASVTRRFFTRERASTRSCRIIGESSTTRQLWGALMESRSSCGLSVLSDEGLRYQNERDDPGRSLAEGRTQRLRSRKPPVPRPEEPARHDARPGVRAEQLEELAVDGDEAGLLGEQIVHDDDADRVVLDVQRDAGGGPDGDRALGHVRDAREERPLDRRALGVGRGAVLQAHGRDR